MFQKNLNRSNLVCTLTVLCTLSDIQRKHSSLFIVTIIFFTFYFYCQYLPSSLSAIIILPQNIILMHSSSLTTTNTTHSLHIFSSHFHIYKHTLRITEFSTFYFPQVSTNERFFSYSCSCLTFAIQLLRVLCDLYLFNYISFFAQKIVASRLLVPWRKG